MRNKFNATCACCGGVVLAGEGDTNKNEAGKWVTKHASKCPPVQRRAAVGGHGHWAHLSDAQDECYELYGMSDADFRDAMNPDEGDR